MFLLRRIKPISLNNKRNYNSKLILNDEVTNAKVNNLPIVALESTIITHGMPFPQNYETAVRVESAIRKKGAVPATIGIVKGKIKVGLTGDELEKLGREVGVVKCGRRDICSLMVDGLDGGTTVGGTLSVAHLAGIQVMATGGIGGVHRDVEHTFDISSDLIVLSRTPLILVSAGIKPILDIQKTLEFLETLGVPVMSIGDANTFPAFYSRFTSDKIKSPAKVKDAKAAASCYLTQKSLGFESGILFGVPIPEEDAIPPEIIDEYILKAIKESKQFGIKGKHVTPYLLKRVNELSSGESLAANIALIKNNAEVAADIAIELSKLTESVDVNSDSKVGNDEGRGKGPVVIGGAVLDTTLQVKDKNIQFDGRTHQGITCNNFGGVGRNVAAALVDLNVLNTYLITVVGDDQPGRRIVQSLGTAGLTIAKLLNKTTAQYTGVVDKNGECRFGFGQMDIFQFINVDLLKQHQSTLERANFIVLDGNPPLETLRWIIEFASERLIPIWFEPTDSRKAAKIFQAHQDWEKVVHFVSPNLKELLAIANHFSIETPATCPHEMTLFEAKTVAEKLAQKIPVVITTLGSLGVLVTRRGSGESPFYLEDSRRIVNEDGCIQTRFYPPLVKTRSKVSESGCGDCLAAGIISGVLKGLDEKSCVNIGLRAAELSLQSSQTVPESLQQLK